MFKKAVESIIGGALGIAALYVVGHLAYQAGQEVAREEYCYHSIRKANEKAREKVVLSLNEQEKTTIVVPSEIDPIFLPKKKQSKLGLLFGAKKIFGDHKSVIGNLIKNPEEHRFEAFVEGNELQIHVKRKEDS